jgi:hypothetical protein
MARAVTVTVEAGTPRVGLWCDRCLLPSAVEIDYWAFSGSRILALGVKRLCKECGANGIPA